MNDEDTMGSSVLDALTDSDVAQLKAHGFDEEAFERLRDRLRSGTWTERHNEVEGRVEAPAVNDVEQLPVPGSARELGLRERGMEALRGGEVGTLVLNGGMATRFGGGVKGCVEVLEGRSFLGMKLGDARAWGRVPVLLMNSFATDAPTKEHLEANDYFGLDPEQVIAFTQNVSVRLRPDGEVFGAGEPGGTLYAPGHGDLPEALGRGALEAFRERGGRYLMMSNVDNVLADLDPVVVGMHVEAAESRGVEMSVEVVQKFEGDQGGMPARVDGALQILEAFRFPQGFDVDSIPVFNTNTFMFTAEALERDFDLTWFLVRKQVEGQRVVQFERLAGELSAHLKTRFVEVARTGARSRFLPIKRREDLREHRQFLADVVGERGAE
ncbi:UTP--glucose-1-phosphate uridylyltransferase [Lujinxingia vulgaris]|nr:UTP--glucose-1-phosphate uridylyltransferase [Lujinxingia vulgaris]